MRAVSNAGSLPSVLTNMCCGSDVRRQWDGGRAVAGARPRSACTERYRPWRWGHSDSVSFESTTKHLRVAETNSACMVNNTWPWTAFIVHLAGVTPSTYGGHDTDRCRVQQKVTDWRPFDKRRLHSTSVAATAWRAARHTWPGPTRSM